MQVAKAIGRVGPQKTEELELLEKLVVARERDDTSNSSGDCINSASNASSSNGTA